MYSYTKQDNCISRGHLNVDLIYIFAGHTEQSVLIIPGLNTPLVETVA